ncbi:unnamed protein product, partial [marine sediment metagenome]
FITCHQDTLIDKIASLDSYNFSEIYNEMIDIRTTICGYEEGKGFPISSIHTRCEVPSIISKIYNLNH